MPSICSALVLAGCLTCKIGYAVNRNAGFSGVRWRRGRHGQHPPHYLSVQSSRTSDRNETKVLACNIFDEILVCFDHFFEGLWCAWHPHTLVRVKRKRQLPVPTADGCCIAAGLQLEGLVVAARLQHPLHLCQVSHVQPLGPSSSSGPARRRHTVGATLERCEPSRQLLLPLPLLLLLLDQLLSRLLLLGNLAMLDALLLCCKLLLETPELPLLFSQCLRCLNRCGSSAVGWLGRRVLLRLLLLLLASVTGWPCCFAAPVCCRCRCCWCRRLLYWGLPGLLLLLPLAELACVLALETVACRCSSTGRKAVAWGCGLRCVLRLRHIMMYRCCPSLSCCCC